MKHQLNVNCHVKRGFVAINQRTAITNADNARWVYSYDALGQVISGKKYWSDGTPVAGQQFEYGFDDIGNRKNTKVGGDQNGANLRPANYTNNTLNQITGRGVPGYVEVLGLALATNTVTVNGQSTYRKGEYFRKELTVNNSSAPVWTNLSVAAAGETTVAGNVFVSKTPETFGYDADGNLTNDGRWTLTWDAENRLVRLVAATSTGPQQRIDFAYDWQGRRIGKKVWNNTAGTGNPAVDERFVYDGWNLIAVLNPQSSILKSFMWGLDLSGTLQGAGGVGGLVKVFDQPANKHYFPGYDGNGNVVLLVNGDTGEEAARYEYGPFGETVRMTGPVAKANPFRFSTKFQDDETDLLYYGYRYYDPSTGRWLNRDPIEENGGINLYGFVHNDPVDKIDPFGKQVAVPIPVPPITIPVPPPAILIGGAFCAGVAVGTVINECTPVGRIGEGIGNLICRKKPRLPPCRKIGETPQICRYHCPGAFIEYITYVKKYPNEPCPGF
ncbi:MAG: RHS repeat-associated core domain-containing protein [Verrucomicrobiae bacterium]|nr:RHS repeat-associated core domain-containing protein [Verrucomicrobiae bacterium]